VEEHARTSTPLGTPVSTRPPEYGDPRDDMLQVRLRLEAARLQEQKQLL
jgi:hypothetical protein